MKTTTLAMAFACALLLAACGKEPPAASQAASTAKPNVAPPSAALRLPVTLEGTLTVDVANDAGSWGTFIANGNEYMVSIPRAVYDNSRLREDGGNARLTLSGQETKGGITTYTASAAQRM